MIRRGAEPHCRPRNVAISTPNGRTRPVIGAITPEVDGGRYPAKRTVGEELEVQVVAFVDGHDTLDTRLLHRRASESDWTETRMVPIGNDLWRATFPLEELGEYRYTAVSRVDPLATWGSALRKKVEAHVDFRAELLQGALFFEHAAARSTSSDATERLKRAASAIREEADTDPERAALLALDPELFALADACPDRSLEQRYDRELTVLVERPRARFSTWYELFPRSTSPTPGQHGTFADTERLLPRIAEMGFDVLYLPPIHPIGETHRKGKNNTTVAKPGDVGSPWAIGGKAGGHKAIHPELGTLEDFRHLVDAAHELGIDIAMDIAFQCSPDHPYVREHPEWFRHRPDGSIQYAENPPKKYQDIYPFDFETEARQSLWEELESIFLYWIDQGIRTFRVDNPHTKSMHFWEWVLGRLKKRHPEVIFLSEAFTRPHVLEHLAKVGFSQSYTYFTWRNTAWELRTYLRSLLESGRRDFLRYNFWPNTPDILPEYLQVGGEPAHRIRLILAATLAANYGIYGAPFERFEATPLKAGGEEYRDSEKYELRHWPEAEARPIHDLMARLNRIRRENPPLQFDHTLLFHESDNDQLLCYSKHLGEDVLIVVVNLDFHHRQSGFISLDLDALGLELGGRFQAHDLLGGARYLWRGNRQFLELDPHGLPAHILRVRRHVRTEADFEYYL